VHVYANRCEEKQLKQQCRIKLVQARACVLSKHRPGKNTHLHTHCSHLVRGHTEQADGAIAFQVG
jgi:hypothetical protein